MSKRFCNQKSGLADQKDRSCSRPRLQSYWWNRANHRNKSWYSRNCRWSLTSLRYFSRQGHRQKATSCIACLRSCFKPVYRTLDSRWNNKYLLIVYRRLGNCIMFWFRTWQTTSTKNNPTATCFHFQIWQQCLALLWKVREMSVSALKLPNYLSPSWRECLRFQTQIPNTT